MSKSNITSLVTDTVKKHWDVEILIANPTNPSSPRMLTHTSSIIREPKTETGHDGHQYDLILECITENFERISNFDLIRWKEVSVTNNTKKVLGILKRKNTKYLLHATEYLNDLEHQMKNQHPQPDGSRYLHGERITPQRIRNAKAEIELLKGIREDLNEIG